MNRRRFHACFREGWLEVAAASGRITDGEKQALRRTVTVMRAAVPSEVLEELMIRK